MKKMSSRERVLAAFARQPVDRPPVITISSVMTVESQNIVGVKLPETHNDAEKMARLAATAHDLLGFDSVMPYFGMQQDSQALGGKVNLGQIDTMPAITEPLYSDPDEFTYPEDFLDRPPVKAVLDAIRLLRKKYGDEVAICGKVIGPWSATMVLIGVENLLIGTIDDPDRIKQFLEKFRILAIKFGAAQIEAGIDILNWNDHATGDLVSAKTYEELLFPLHKTVLKEFHANAPKRIPIILHTCGKTLDRMPLFAQTGFDGFHFDSKNDVAESLRLTAGNILLCGCVTNVDVLLNGTREDVKKQTSDLLKAGVPIISPECAIPLRVKNDNLRAIVETVEASRQ